MVNKIKGSTVIAEILHKEKVPFITAFPGGGPNSPVAQIVNESHRKGVRTILPRTERGVVNIVDGYARVSGKVGVCALYEGPGVENAYSGVAQAYSDGSRVLILAGQARRSAMAYDSPNNDVDGVNLFSNCTKWVKRANVVQDIPYLMRRAYTKLRNGKPGPVYLELVFDIVTEELDESAFDYLKVEQWRTQGDPRDVEKAVKILLGAKNPLIYAGEGVFYADASKELAEFADLMQIPVMTTLKGKGLFSESNELSVGSGGATGISDLQHYFTEADLVLGIGVSFTRGPGVRMQNKTKYIQVVINEDDVNKQAPISQVVFGDAKLVLKQLIQEVRKQTNGAGRKRDDSLIREIEKQKAGWLQRWKPLLTSNEVPINPYRLIWDMVNTFDLENTIITHDAGWPRAQIAPFWKTTVPRGYFGWGHHSTLGFSVAAMIGAKLAAPEKTCVSFTGDGAFGEGGIELETAVRYGIPILVIIPNNIGLGHYSMDTPSLNVLGGDYAKIAEGMGAYSERVETPDEIIPALKRAMKVLESNQPALLDVICKREWANQNSGVDAKPPKLQA